MNDESKTAINSWESLFRAQVTVLRKLNQEFPSGELSLNEYDVLFNLSRQEGHKLRIRDLNRHLLLTQPSVSRLVDRLLARGLVRKESDPGDGRGTFVCLTDEGYALFRRVAVSHSASIARHVGGALTTTELQQLSVLSDKLRRSIDATEE
ncbi:MarR family winged helix-turn-helix transcriptional regulator [Glaciihabitans sp. dw_435]|uniref:MarR family winged helix-turn-helix transcriptional regulator n=1 Tax=Glaciihabitans sp. dw_435 TaxID=2720081 RepID=UPI001BD35E0F|nr:MarR family transcriptional regulator [Glaciihabitans sp. dw_435]